MRPRLIPVLLLDRRRRLVKTVGFGPRTYVGDPFNVVRLFNEKEVDELVVLDIDASLDGRDPDVGFLRELAGECFMPLAYGGGLTSLERCERLNRVGIEKFVLGRSARDFGFVRSLGQTVGAQAVVACVDVLGGGASASPVLGNGKVPVGMSLQEYCQALQDAGAGELLLQSVERDGARDGYDLELIASVAAQVHVPVVAMGGAGSLPHLLAALRSGASAAASGSTFCFIGRLRAVLVTYPTPAELAAAGVVGGAP